jgi:hypothetical protein
MGPVQRSVDSFWTNLLKRLSPSGSQKERDVVLIKDPEEFVPGDPVQPVVVIAARLVIVDLRAR